MSTIRSRPASVSNRALRLTCFATALLWLVAIVVTDAIEEGATRNGITDAPAALHTISGHQTDIVIGAMSSFYLAVVLVLLAAALCTRLGGGLAGMSTFGGAILSAGTVALGGTVSFAELTAVHHHDLSALTTLGYLVSFAWAWQGVAWGFLLLTTGCALLARGFGPCWFAIATLVLGVPVILGPGAVLFWGLAPAWFAGLAFVTTARQEGDTEPPPLTSHVDGEAGVRAGAP